MVIVYIFNGKEIAALYMSYFERFTYLLPRLNHHRKYRSLAHHCVAGRCAIDYHFDPAADNYHFYDRYDISRPRPSIDGHLMSPNDIFDLIATHVDIDFSHFHVSFADDAMHLLSLDQRTITFSYCCRLGVND